jgi:TolB-like protein/DNA-binding winged helix-turn-helix (wHTH) protein
METSPSSRARFRFAEFEVDVCSRELRKHGERIHLQEQPFQVLVFLLSRRGDVVSREELRAEIWPKGTFVDFDHGLNTAIKKIRVALGDNANVPRYVETIPKRGYRFLKSVEVVVEAGFHKVECDDAEPSKTTPRISMAVFRNRWLAAIAIASLTAIGLGYLFYSHVLSKNVIMSKRIVLIVLPFENLSGDAAQDYLCQGFTEELGTQFGRADPSRLAVIARVTAAAYAPNRTVAEIGRDLHVDYVLEGSVRRDARHVRVTAQLIRVRDQSHIWANEFDRELDSVLALQGEVAGEIVKEVQSSIASPLNPFASRVAVEYGQDATIHVGPTTLFRLPPLRLWSTGFDAEEPSTKEPGAAALR